MKLTFVNWDWHICAEGDRKAYFETFEQRKKTNELQIKELRKKNKELRDAIVELKQVHPRLDLFIIDFR